MKTPALLLLSCLSFSLWASPAPLLEAEARHAVQALAGRLQEEMHAALNTGGAQAAIASCNAQALPLTEQISREQGLIIRRTALRVRNPANNPDPWETRVLESFVARQQVGQPLKGMSFSELVEENGQRYFRMLQAIPTQNQCLECHGSELAPEIEAKLNQLYPNDRARGFSAGDLRGAFSIRRLL